MKELLKTISLFLKSLVYEKHVPAINKNAQKSVIESNILSGEFLKLTVWAVDCHSLVFRIGFE